MNHLLNCGLLVRPVRVQCIPLFQSLDPTTTINYAMNINLNNSDKQLNIFTLLNPINE